MVELMVVVGIIAVLVTLIIAVVPPCATAGRKASVQQQINTLQSAIDAYYLDYRAYPGPLADASVYIGDRPPGRTSPAARRRRRTSSSACSAGCAASATSSSYDPDRVGKGAVNFLPEAPSMPKPYMDIGRRQDDALRRRFKDATGRTANDSNIPEFVDGFEEPLPLLYLRARPGSTGIVGPAYQYDVRR